MRFVYTSFLYLLTPFLLFRLWWKGRSLPAYRQRIKERFMCSSVIKQPVKVWIHAVSLGEVIAASPLIEAMLDKNWSVLVTTMTPTGSERVQAAFGPRVAHQYLPYDLPWLLRRFFKIWQPKVGIIMETELWPNLIYSAKQARVPLILANARLSNRSFSAYHRFRFVFKPILNEFFAILTQSAEDASRFLALGAAPQAVRNLGNIKFDLQTLQIESSDVNKLQQRWGEQRVVLIAASTHEGEEVAILARFHVLKQSIPGILLLIAPRHPERFQAVLKLCQHSGFNVALRSDSDGISSDNEIIVLDSLGELIAWYQLSDYAFVGGSLVPIGGHNVLEPIAVNVPVLSGRHIHNFQAICADLSEAHAIKLVADADELMDVIIELHRDKLARQQMIDNASRVLANNKGSLQKYLDHIELAL